MISTKRVAVIMPGYNVSRTVVQALLAMEPLMGAGIDEVIFIDNKSSDDTLNKVGMIQAQNPLIGPRLTLIKNVRNHGYGGSLKIGLAYIQQRNFTHCMFLHSDDQGDNYRIAEGFLDALRGDPAMELILASRFHPEAHIKDYSLIRRLGNGLFNILIRLITGVTQSDPGTGITCVQTRLVREIPYPLFTSDLFFNLMLNIFLLHDHKIRCGEIPLHWADSTIGSTVMPWRHVVKMTNLLLGYGVRHLRGHPGFVDQQKISADWLAAYPHAITTHCHATLDYSFTKKSKLLKPKTFILDVDGVMTTGQFHYTSEGKGVKIFGPDDSDGLILLKPHLEIRFISGDKRGFAISKKRIVDDMGYPLDLVSVTHRIDWIRERFDPAEVIFMGDGIFDGHVLTQVGYGIAPANAGILTRQCANFVTSRNGGDRAVAEACLHILETFFVPFDATRHASHYLCVGSADTGRQSF